MTASISEDGVLFLDTGKATLTITLTKEVGEALHFELTAWLDSLVERDEVKVENEALFSSVRGETYDVDALARALERSRGDTPTQLRVWR